MTRPPVTARLTAPVPDRPRDIRDVVTGLAVLLHRLAKLPAYPSSFGAWVLALTAEAVARDLQALAHDLRGSQWTAVPARIIGGRAALILAAGELLLAAGVRPGGDDA